MYNEPCKVDETCREQDPVDSMKNILIEILDRAVKAREMAVFIHKNLFGQSPIIEGDGSVESIFDIILEIKKIEKDTMEILYGVINRIGE